MKTLKKVFNIDIIYCSLFIVFLLFMINTYLSNLNLEFLDPIQKALDSFQSQDLVYTAVRDEPPKDTNITMVNFGNLGRGDLGRLIMNLNKYDPLVIGIDAFYRKDKTQYYRENGLEDGDSVLAKAFSETKNLVLVTKLVDSNEDDKWDTLETSNPKFHQYANGGYANMITAEKEFRVSRKITPQQILNGKREMFFPVKIASFLDSAKAEKFLARKNELETIYYRGNINNFDGETDVFGKPDAFNRLDWQEILEDNFDPKLVKNKIIVMGYMGESLKNNLYWDEDKFYTPLNKKFAGKSFPDMYGVTVHGNVVSMVLNETYVDHTSERTELIINILICVFNVLLFTYIHHEMKLWWDGVSVIVTFAEAIILLIIEVFVFLKFNLEISLNYSLVFVFLLGNLLEFYYDVSKPGLEKLFSFILSRIPTKK
ncbi:MAG: CHASE2 domain-containing protein [Cytophagales bacterium]|nr:CHASE2 domain-containing protein [Cytophagales bacterium]